MTNKKHKILKGICHNLGQKFLGYSCTSLIQSITQETNHKGGKFVIDVLEKEINPGIKVDKNAVKSLSDLYEWFVHEINRSNIEKEDIDSVKINFTYFPKRFLLLIKYYKYQVLIIIKTKQKEIRRELSVNGWL